MNIRKIIREEMDDLDWIREIPLLLPKNHQPKKGSIMICIPGFNLRANHKYQNASRDPNYGGDGYKEGRVITAGRITYDGYRTVVWPNDGGSGIYVDALNYY